MKKSFRGTFFQFLCVTMAVKNETDTSSFSYFLSRHIFFFFTTHLTLKTDNVHFLIAVNFISAPFRWSNVESKWLIENFLSFLSCLYNNGAAKKKFSNKSSLISCSHTFFLAPLSFCSCYVTITINPFVLLRIRNKYAASFMVIFFLKNFNSLSLQY